MLKMNGREMRWGKEKRKIKGVARELECRKQFKVTLVDK